ncbi:hypothetical protein ABPG72_003724 [Tetrahymena utriculariae]
MKSTFVNIQIAHIAQNIEHQELEFQQINQQLHPKDQQIYLLEKDISQEIKCYINIFTQMQSTCLIIFTIQNIISSKYIIYFLFNLNPSIIHSNKQSNKATLKPLKTSKN